MAKIVVLAPVPAALVEHYVPGHEVVAVPPDGDPVEACRGATICIGDWSANHVIAGDVVDALAPTCELVQIPAAGLDSVDVAACAAAGVPVGHTPGVNVDSVAEWCVWAALSALRGLPAAHVAMQRGEWTQQGPTRFELPGKVVGIVGMGAIARAAVPRFQAFGGDVRYWTRTRRTADVEAELDISYRDLDDLVAEADVLVLLVALTEDTTGLLSRERIARMKSTSVVVNAARGRVADEDALAEALVEGRLHGVATDVFASEPAGADHPLVLAGATVTPHLAGATVEAVTRMLAQVFANITAVLEGGELTDLATP